MKVCIKCGFRLEASSFHRSKSHSDKRKNVCKLCAHEEKLKYNAANRKAVRLQSAKWWHYHPKQRAAKKLRWKLKQIKKLGSGYLRNRIRDRGRFKGRKGVRIYLSHMHVPEIIVEAKRAALADKRIGC